MSKLSQQWSLIILCVLTASTALSAQWVSAELITAHSSQGTHIFNTTQQKNKGDYWRLSQYFTTQQSKTFCGIASATIVLNTLNHRQASALHNNSVLWINQAQVFNTHMPISFKEEVRQHGMRLDQLTTLLRKHGLIVTQRFASSSNGINSMRQELIAALRQPHIYVIINYDRSVLGQEGQGHFSPLGAYNQKHDRFLVMDVTNNLYPMVWVKAKDLYRAMHQPSDHGHVRGWLVVYAKINKA
jgi:hypothetical protein